MKIRNKLDYYQDLINRTGFHAPIGETINLQFTSISHRFAQLDLEVDHRHLNSLGTVQGGVLTIMADAAMGISFASLLDLDQKFTTLELKVNFIKSVTEGHLRAIGRVTHSGKRTGIAECNIFQIDAERKDIQDLIAIASSTLLLL